MMDFLFFVKTFILTIAVVLAMQIHIGSTSIENHAMSFVQNSALVAPLNSVAYGGAKFIRNMTQSIYARIRYNTKKSKHKVIEDESSSSSSVSEFEGQD